MVLKPFIISVIVAVAVATILMLGVLAAISTTKQVYAYNITHTYEENRNGVTYTCKKTTEYGLYGHNMGNYTICKPKPKTGAQLEEESQTALQKQDCMQLKAKMANNEAAASQYKSKDCESLLK